MIDHLSILKKFLCQFYQIPDKEWEFIVGKIEYREFHKNEIITPQNSVENYVHFILQGISRVYFDNGDKTYTLDFAFNNNMTSSYSSFFTRSASRFNLEAITDMQVLSLSHHNLEEIQKKNNCCKPYCNKNNRNDFHCNRE